MKKDLLILIVLFILLAPNFALGQPTVEVGAVEPILLESPLVRVKDIARFQGVRDNQLYAPGLVIGLEGTGDGTGGRTNVQMIANMLEGFGITVSPDDLRLRNVAAVMVTADIPSSVRSGDRIDVTVSSMGDARSLQGGFLLQTPLQAANGEIYAAAQGAVSIGGFNVRGGGASVQRNHATVGTIPNGAIIEQEIDSSFSNGEFLSLVLNQPDFTTAARLENIINEVFEPDTARAQDQSTVNIQIPTEHRERLVSFIAQIEELPIRPDSAARVVIDERTGTVVMGQGVRLATIAVSHGNLNVRIQPNVDVSQPPAFTEGETVVSEEVDIEVEEETNQLMVVEGGSNVQELVDALNAIGASSRDIIAIMQSVKATGALYGELIIR